MISTNITFKILRFHFCHAIARMTLLAKTCFLYLGFMGIIYLCTMTIQSKQVCQESTTESELQKEIKLWGRVGQALTFLYCQALHTKILDIFIFK